ncbi:universal stress protein [Saccharospirillum salsuginis]|uniref:Universal stress protein YxiE n=1 Tax=Saccharospirillum salsuginis TaxID=418750 RepID=A0A918KS88_9GAMM|nr:universal stress protein [Saccharospirillum salsuginis]GGX71281.1 universal stress protein YxiE [Saccharospirillum salsuginis]
MSKTVLVPVDGSEQSKKAIEFAADWAKHHDGKLHLFHVPEPAAGDEVMVLGGASITLHASREELEEAGHQILEAAAGIVRDQGVTDVETSLEIGDPARKIIAKAETLGVDMIVMGTRGLGDWKSLLIGSVSHKVSHLAPCTCVTVR